MCITEIIKSRPVLMTRDRTDNGMLQGHGSRLSVRVCYCEEYSVLKIRRKENIRS